MLSRPLRATRRNATFDRPTVPQTCRATVPMSAVPRHSSFPVGSELWLRCRRRAGSARDYVRMIFSLLATAIFSAHLEQSFSSAVKHRDSRSFEQFGEHGVA